MTEANESVAELRETLGALGLVQRQVAQLFGVSPRSVRHWQYGDRRVPCGVNIVCRLLAAGAVTVAQVEQVAVLAPVRTNGRAKPEPLVPLFVEPAPAQAALARAEAATLAEKVIALASEACRWPCGDPRHPDFRFCGNPVAEKPYCDYPRAMAYKPRPQQAPVGGQKPSRLLRRFVYSLPGKVPTMLAPELYPPPCPSDQQEPQTTDPSVEQLIGDLVAATACLFAQGLGECWAGGKMNGQMSADTKQQGSALIAGLLELRNGIAGELDFNAVARSHGARVLKDRYGQGISDKTINSLINAALEVLGRIVRARLN